MNMTVPLWVLTGSVSSVIAPAILLTARHLRRLRLFDRFALPVRVIGPVFVAIHAAVTISLLDHLAPWLWALVHLVLLVGAIEYWLPVLGSKRRVTGLSRWLYFVFTSPLLDWAALAIVLLGHPAGGIAMILAMLPVNLTALWLLWQWMQQEEGAEVTELSYPHAVPPGFDVTTWSDHR
jgi:cytochrome c oxidase assembly factor CtaG